MARRKDKQTGPMRVLVVDDNADAADTVGILLEAQGYEVEVCHGGQAAIDRAPAFRPQVVLLDLAMPQVDGFQAAVAIRAALATPVRIIALTGHGDGVSQARAVAAGFDLHLLKPVGGDDLVNLLAKMKRP